MMHTVVDCPLCGHVFDASRQAACSTCPLHRGCHMICCPACGHTTVDPGQSRLAQWLSSLLARTRDAQPVLTAAGSPSSVGQRLVLAHAPVGCMLRILGFADLPSTSHEHLQAYGLMPGQVVCVLQHRPVTIVQVDRIELALEAEIARCVLVAAADGSSAQLACPFAATTEKERRGPS